MITIIYWIHVTKDVKHHRTPSPNGAAAMIRFIETSMSMTLDGWTTSTIAERDMVLDILGEMRRRDRWGGWKGLDEK